ncbi:hypothetical protein [Methylobacterium sp. J-076]|uniref:hypothetical protein n=1 Tax=Methylobacterium sp. J-076 TaxID=2836655 RepID=UPI001FBB1C4E|nr:hypothetical protein [Methylobacterium sp. J-076]MCJ2014316.1 hypothetical protein [Methylobacterium sp. J-076]
MSHNAQPLNARDVLRLSTKLAERMLHTNSTGHAFSVDELEAVVKAAEFLHAHNVPWPAVVTEIIDMLVAQKEAIGLAAGDTAASGSDVIR